MYDVIIIGSGPAGLMASIEASKNNHVLLIEKNAKPGNKLLITGGGRCNVTNLKSNNDFLNQISHNKKYLYSAINKFGPNDIYNFFIDNNVPLKEEKENQIFPVSDKAMDILQALLRNTKNVEFKYKETVLDIKKGSVKTIITDKGKYQAKNIIIATGGTSFKATGSNGDNMKFAKMLNQPITSLFPVEAPVILEEENNLAGTALNEVLIKYKNVSETGNLIFTHKGISGSAIMKLSEHIYQNEDKKITIDLLPNLNQNELNDFFTKFDQEKELVSFLNNFFSKKFSLYLSHRTNLNKKLKAINLKEQENIFNLLKQCSFTVKETGSIEEAFVTGGGIAMDSINSMTMESTINKGIYFVGEALDIHGPVGGYNITLALSTGYLAGCSIKKEKDLCK